MISSQRFNPPYRKFRPYGDTRKWFSYFVGRSWGEAGTSRQRREGGAGATVLRAAVDVLCFIVSAQLRTC
ncbi:hypothetical protein NDU88_005101 [Pleurodeles waltl]|uniref:Uncharacterized protein n=1 Tax=Pleurodeles waltl TaxID=8319 RepID=A0AAV7PMQ0_PLEWA|nr:hypothetical protein NDU88_005101 [Pleurodeles waltl]